MTRFEPLRDQVGRLKALFCHGIEQSPLKDPLITQLVWDLLLLRAERLGGSESRAEMGIISIITPSAKTRCNLYPDTFGHRSFVFKILTLLISV